MKKSTNDFLKKIIHFVLSHMCFLLLLGFKLSISKYHPTKAILNYQKNRKLNISKHVYECSNVLFKTMPIYKTDDNTLLQAKGKISQKNLSLH